MQTCLKGSLDVGGCVVAYEQPQPCVVWVGYVVENYSGGVVWPHSAAGALTGPGHLWGAEEVGSKLVEAGSGLLKRMLLVAHWVSMLASCARVTRMPKGCTSAASCTGRTC